MKNSYQNGFVMKFLGTIKGIAKQPSRYVRRYLIESRGNQCEQCHWSQIHPITGNVPIQLDHIDGNSLNTVLDNLRLLCPNCHSLTSTYGALNIGNGRGHRRKNT